MWLPRLRHRIAFTERAIILYLINSNPPASMKPNTITQFLLFCCLALGVVSSPSCSLLDPCSDVNCLNGGTCVSGDCDCPVGFTGADCGIEDRCITQNVSCLNGGTCNNGACACPDGFSGPDCSVEDRCITQAVNCLNGGTCNDGTCDCPDGFTGPDCGTLDPAAAQALLDSGNFTPLQLVNAGIPLANLYGKTYQGGLIYFINTDPAAHPNFSGEGLVATPTRYGFFDPWGCTGVVTGASGRLVGDGATNHAAILAASCPDAMPISSMICDTLTLGGYTDWVLPSIDELNLMYNNLHLNGHGNFNDNIGRYQSSTELNENRFVARFFTRDEIFDIQKFSGDDIRPSRTF